MPRRKNSTIVEVNLKNKEFNFFTNKIFILKKKINRTCFRHQAFFRMRSNLKKID
jgi:hypothetical protein